MAARLHPALSRTQEIVDLRRLAARDMEGLLAEETAAWRDELEWDFGKAADLVMRFVDLRALNGSALLEDGEVIGYVYYVVEEHKGLIGDLYVRKAYRGVDPESRLLEAALDPLLNGSEIARVECQLMMLHPAANRVLPRAAQATSFDRLFLRLDLARAVLRESPVRHPIFIERWSDHYQDAGAQLIAEAYRGHVDSLINDQYRSGPSARRFLYNIVQYPGCGVFYRPASYAAFDVSTGRLCGISLASVVAPQCGHIAQICVSPEMQGTGVGYALLRHSLTSLRDAQCRSASLTVTAANTGAVSLYERVGFITLRRFAAFVWAGFGK
ncbi:MAG TPA: GNAT family N-acetyltransferase [Bryobacteraceae bacterium]|jgi:ribosomal protein S18 acetylase RimI-like enzyme|nr:GNAT family N-acetyltransferase [Bryobacteraceae bacterium]